ncbi:MAG: hypothetical protein ABSG57_03550 [Candidatus Bathyarchaeia archaeon]|jgi:hypothetical protein
MKSRLVVSIVISILIASALAASYTGYTTVFAKPTHGFTLTLTGTAYDPHKHVYVNVALTLTGTADGKLKIEIDLHVKGGDVSVNHGYGTFSVSRGSGELVSHCHYIALYLWLTPKYGGKTALWCMSGKTGTLSGQTLHVSLGASHVILPMKGSPRLDDLDLKGTITPVY